MEVGRSATLADDEYLRAWSSRYDWCACCWADHLEAARLYGVGLQTHHIIKRSRARCDRAFNLLRLCGQCHDLAEGLSIRVRGELLPKLTEGVCLWLKLLEYPDEWQPRKLAGLIAPRPLDALLPIPQFFVLERHRRRPYIDWRELGVPA